MAGEQDEVIQIKKNDWDALIKKVDGFVTETQEERRKRQEAEAERDLALAKTNKVEPPAAADEVGSKVEEALAKRDEATAKAARERAKVTFQSSHKEFHPDNDPGGIKYAAFERSLGKLNMNGLQSETDFLNTFNDALKLMGQGNQPAPKNTPLDASMPKGGGSGPNLSEESQLTSKEQQLLKQMDWDEARYLKIKDKRPYYVQSLLKHME